MKNLLFVLFVITMAVVKGQSSKTLSDKNAIKREVSSFNVIEVQGPFTVYFSSGKSFALAISASNESVRDRINTSITDGKLKISFGDHGKRGWQQNENMKIYLSAPTLNKIVASGAVDFIIFDEL